jgi:DNA-binding NarL/FixJ family response regulator
VDSDPRAARALRLELEAKVPGCRVAVFESAIEEMFALASGPPDVLLLDIGEMQLTPAEVLRRICSHGGEPAFPVLAIAVNETLREGALAAGARSFLVKPCKVDEVLEILGPLASGSGPRPHKRK